MKTNARSVLPILMLLAMLAACGKTHSAGGPRSLADLAVNGNGVDGSVHENTRAVYTLKNIQKGQNYTLRTEIGLLPGGSAPDGTLTVNVYSSMDALRADPTATVTSASPLHEPNNNIYEVFFLAPSSGDYVVAISGASISVPAAQFFSNLRLMSADPTVAPSPLTGTFTPVSSAIGTAYEVRQANALNPGFLNIYNGGDIASSGSFTISLVSNTTTTLANPQIFVYKDSSLTTDGLLLSSIPTSTEFVVYTFDAGVLTDITEQPAADVISNVTFSSGPGGGPFIVLKGFVSAVTYTLSIGP